MNRDITIDEYLNSFSPDVNEKLKNMAELALKVAPAATPGISYGMPTFKINKQVLVHFAAFKNHIGMYPIPNTIEMFEKELKSYKTSKGGIQFPLNQDLPVKLIEKMLAYRLSVIE